MYPESEAGVFEDMIGQTFESVTGSIGGDELEFLRADGSGFRFYHSQNCCESVEIADIDNELSVLEGSPLVQAEQVSNVGAEPPKKEYVDSYTWTFYKFATAKGSVTVRWLGESNGYYSESVDRYEIPARGASR